MRCAGAQRQLDANQSSMFNRSKRLMSDVVPCHVSMAIDIMSKCCQVLMHKHKVRSYMFLDYQNGNLQQMLVDTSFVDVASQAHLQSGFVNSKLAAACILTCAAPNWQMPNFESHYKSRKPQIRPNPQHLLSAQSAPKLRDALGRQKSRVAVTSADASPNVEVRAQPSRTRERCIQRAQRRKLDVSGIQPRKTGPLE